uniref:Insulin-induced gene protein n=1 Tax=Canis lupus familiaris TaxID=9615 RepID=A0A8C0S0G0_CANLF
MAEEETESPGPKKRGPYISSVTSRSVNLMIRGVVLFFIGVFLALVLNLLQIQRNVTLFPPDVIASIFSSAWWVPPCCGTASAVIGLLYPCIDRHLGEPHKFKREWSSVMRCVAVFVGINHASAKVDFDNNIQLSLTLAALSIGLWWTFDRSRSGFGLGVGIAFLATLVTQLLVYNGVYHMNVKLLQKNLIRNEEAKIYLLYKKQEEKGMEMITISKLWTVKLPGCSFPLDWCIHICVCVCVCMRIYRHKYIRIHTHICMHICIHMHIHIYYYITAICDCFICKSVTNLDVFDLNNYKIYICTTLNMFINR